MYESKPINLDKPDLIIAWCEKCKEFRFEQPNGIILEDTIMESQIENEGHAGKAIKLYLRKKESISAVDER